MDIHQRLTYLFFLIWAKSIASTKILEFSNQKEDFQIQPTTYAILKSEHMLESARFTICSSIYIGYFRGGQAFYTLRRHDTLWFSLTITEQDLHRGVYSYNVFLAFNGGGEFGNADKLSLRPHAWSHSCTSVDGGRVTVVINGILTHEVVIQMEEVSEKHAVVLQDNIILGVKETKFSGSNTNTKQSEASISNLNVHSNLFHHQDAYT